MFLWRLMALGSSRGKGTPVKPMSKLARAFEGWQAGLVVILVSALVVLVVVPRPVLPDEIPLPSPSPAALRAEMKRDAERARAAEHEELPFEVRAIGDAFRRLGAASAAGQAEDVRRFRFSIGQMIRQHRPDPGLLLRLRAYQTEVFLQALADYERKGVESEDLREVGGDFLQAAWSAGWMRTQRQRPRLIADEPVRFVLYRKRWNEVMGLDEPPFAVSLDEERAFHRFLFAHPVVRVPDVRRLDTRARCRAANEYLLKRVDAYAPIDREYPSEYARGILLLRLGRHEAAAQPLLRFVERNPDGPYTLRARNALRHAHDRMHAMLAE